VVRLVVHVTAKASHPGVTGWRGGELQVRVAVAPEGGKANAEACRTVAAALGIPRSRVSVLRGHASRHKELEIDGIGDAEVRDVFGSPNAVQEGSEHE
jgi:hypothetical protein